MASTDVIRGHVRVRLSCYQLYRYWFQNGTVPSSQCNLERCPSLPMSLASSNGTSPDLDRIWTSGCKSLAVNQERETRLAASVEMGGNGGGGRALSAAMASPDQDPKALPHSGILTGWGRDGVELRSACLFGRPSTTCPDQDSPTISEDNSVERQELNPDVQDLLKVLQEIGISSDPVPYRPQDQRLNSTEIFCKNLFLKDRSGQFFLVICDENQQMDLKMLRRKLKAYRNLSFATSAEMATILHVEPGGVTPFALMHFSARDVRVVMTTEIISDREALLNFHPLDQNLTLPIHLWNLELFLQRYRLDLDFLDMAT